MARISLIVPLYKADEWLPQCMAAIEAQTYRDFELIVVDDDKATGAAAARNRGLDTATGEFIVFCDADDYLEPDALQTMLAAIDSVDMVIGSFRKIGNFAETVTHENALMSARDMAGYAMGNLRNPRTNQLLSGCWAKMYRKSLIRPFPLLARAEDMAQNFDYLQRCASIRMIPDVVYNNRKHKDSLTTTFNGERHPGSSGFLEGLKYVKRFLGPFYPEEEIDNALDSSKVYHSMLYLLRACGESQEVRTVFRRIYG